MSASPSQSTDRRQPAGLLLVGHGTRNRQGQEEFLQTAEMVADRLAPVIVGPCFLELAEPDISTGIAGMFAVGVRSIVVSPLLLFTAGHARHDIPMAVQAAAASYDGLDIRQSDALGCHEAMLRLSVERSQQALADQPAVPAGETSLVLVGRGSRDASATAEMHRFAKLRGGTSAAGSIDVGFMAMAAPTVAEALIRAAERSARRIVVQPHLLFRGDLLARLDREVAAARKQFLDRQWLITPHLGPAPLLVDAIVERYQQALLR